MNQNEGLRNSLVISMCLHIGLMLFLYFGLPTLFKPLPPPWKPIPFEIVEIGAITNTRIQDEPEEVSKPPQPQPKPLEAQKPPEPAKLEPPKPDVPAEALLPKPLPKPIPKPEPPKVKPPEVDQLTSVLKNVAKLKPTPTQKDPKDPTDTDKEAAAEPKSLAPSLSDRLTISEEDLLRRQISQCWNMPVGAKNAESLVVEVLIEVNPDRTVRTAQVVDQSRMFTDPFFRAAGESALRALRNPKCSPLEVPPDKYEEWKTIRFNFDPRDML